MFTLGGVLIDRYGSRLGLAFSVGFWSLATALHALSTNTFHFGALRFLLGVGEGGCFPGAIKAVIEWIPSHKHAIANGIAIGGSAIGAVVAVPLCAFILSHTNWRMLFLISGALGIIWVLFWLRLTNKYSKEQNTADKKRGFSLKALGSHPFTKEQKRSFVHPDPLPVRSHLLLLYVLDSQILKRIQRSFP